MATIGGIDVELIEGPKLSLDSSGWKASEVYKVRWANVLSLASAIFVEPTITGSGVFRWQPQQSPSMDGLLLQADSLAIDPFDDQQPGNTLNTPSAQFARMTVNYKSLTNDEEDEDNPGDDGALFEHQMSIGGEFLTMPARNLHWNSDAALCKDEDVPCGKLVPTIEHNLHWPRIRTLPMAAIRSTIGKLNANSFLGADAGTLMFLGAEISRTVTARQAKAWDLTYRISERALTSDLGHGSGSVTWNHFYRPDKNKWDILEVLGAGTRIYSTANFTSLFQISVA